MSPRVDMVEVYNVQVNVSDCSDADLKRAGYEPPADQPAWNKDKHWVYDDIDRACERIKREVPRLPSGAVIILDVEAMKPSEFAALPPDDDEGECSRPEAVSR